MGLNCREWLTKAMIAGPVVLLAACATPPPPPPPPAPPPPPPPPPAEVIPYRPVPPGGSAYMMDIPRAGPDGRRITINTDLDEDLTIWHFRSALNVAALNCNDPAYDPITQAYSALLNKFERRLRTINTTIDRQYRAQAANTREAAMLREVKMTQVYNYFANPGVRQEFCDEALAVSNEAIATPPEDLFLFASASLSRFESVFLSFFRNYEKYEIESAQWDARYGSRYGASQPGWVALHGTHTPSIGSGLVELGAPSLVGELRDAETGAAIPVVTAPGRDVTVPIVQPLPNDAEGGGS